MWAFGQISSSGAGKQMVHVSFWHADCTKAGIQMACGIHMTVVSTDLMYKLWYVFAICGLWLLESNFLDPSFAAFYKNGVRWKECDGFGETDRCVVAGMMVMTMM